MERDARGRFLPGNRAAVGNKGNKKPKYGNKNAFKHGLCSSFTWVEPDEDGRMLIQKFTNNGQYIGYVASSGYIFYEEEEMYWFHPNLVEAMHQRGISLED
ncbi:hypothetical protein V7101_21055, partial [Bacillus velezensis]|uniref:hypothetical protein n=1 Tax=Bacillus velezensis TaxID=492670 RepID=UPI002FFF2762